MKDNKNITDKKSYINSLVTKITNSNDIQSYKNKVMKNIEENNNRILISLNKDKKTKLLLTRTYYLNEFEKIEKIINNELLNQNITYDKYLLLLSCLNVLFNFEDLYINKLDVFTSLKLESKIISIIKKYIINKLG